MAKLLVHPLVLPRVATRLANTKIQECRASIVIDEEEEAHFEETEEGSNESNGEDCNDEWTAKEVGAD